MCVCLTADRTGQIYVGDAILEVSSYLIATTQWRRQTRGVGCARTPCHEDAKYF